MRTHSPESSVLTRLVMGSPDQVQQLLSASLEFAVDAVWPEGQPSVERGRQLFQAAREERAEQFADQPRPRWARSSPAAHFRNPQLLLELAKDLHREWQSGVDQEELASLMPSLIESRRLPFEGFLLLQDCSPAEVARAVASLTGRGRLDGPRYGPLTLSQQTHLGIDVHNLCILHDLETGGADQVVRQLSKVLPVTDHPDALAAMLENERWRIRAHLRAPDTSPGLVDQFFNLLQRVTPEGSPSSSLSDRYLTLAGASQTVGHVAALLTSEAGRETLTSLAAQASEEFPSICFRGLWGMLRDYVGEKDVVVAYLQLATTWTAQTPLTRDALHHDQKALLEAVDAAGGTPGWKVMVSPRAWTLGAREVLERLRPHLDVPEVTSEHGGDLLVQFIMDNSLTEQERADGTINLLRRAAGAGGPRHGGVTLRTLRAVLDHLPSIDAATLKGIFDAIVDADPGFDSTLDAGTVLDNITSRLAAYIHPKQTDTVVTYDEPPLGALTGPRMRAGLSSALSERLHDCHTPNPALYAAILPYLDASGLEIAVQVALRTHRVDGDETYLNLLLQQLGGKRLLGDVETRKAVSSLLLALPHLVDHPNLTISTDVLARPARVLGRAAAVDRVCELLTRDLGADPAAWAMAIDLLDGWEGNYADLVATVQATASDRGRRNS